MKPNIVRDFNNGMSGIDRSDQMVFYYQGLRKSVQWYEKIEFHFIERFMHNCFYFFNQASPQSKINLTDFRTHVIKSLLAFDKMSRMERKPSNDGIIQSAYQQQKRKKPNLALQTLLQKWSAP